MMAETNGVVERILAKFKAFAFPKGEECAADVQKVGRVRSRSWHDVVNLRL